MAIVWKRFFNLLAFIAVVLIGISLILSYALKSGKLTSLFNDIALIMSVIVVGFYSFFYAWSRPRKGYSQLIHMIIWAAAIVLIVVFIVLPWF